MFAFDFSSHSIEVLQFFKKPFGRLTIAALGKAQLEEEILKGGLVKDENQLSKKILDLINQEHQGLEPDQCLVSLPQGSYYFERFSVSSDLNANLLKEEVVRHLQSSFSKDLKDYVYTYSVVHRVEKEELDILLIASSKENIDSWRKVFLSIGLAPVFLTIGPIATYRSLFSAFDVNGLTAVLDQVNEQISLTFYDFFAPVGEYSGKISVKTLIKDLTAARLEIEEKRLTSVTRLIVGGDLGLGFDSLELEKKLQLSISLAAEYVALEIRKRAADLSQIKLPTTLFAKTLGLMLAFENNPKEFNLLTKSLGTAPSVTPISLPSRRNMNEVEINEHGLGAEPENIEMPTTANRLSRAFKIIIVLAILSVLFIVAGVKAKNFLQNKINKWGEEFLVEVTSTPTIILEEPTPTLTPLPATPTIVLARGDLKMRILNGGGIKGEANRASEMLKGLGYNIVKVGNADSYSYPQTQVSIKESKKIYLDLLRLDLASRYTVSGEFGVVAEGEAWDTVVIVGQK